MLPLALIVRGRGFPVAGSDRSLDQGRTPQKFDFLRQQGIALFPQNGSGITGGDQIVITSTAVEATVPDVETARRQGATLLTRAELLAELFNAAPMRVAIGGTSGKSTTTGMIGWILQATGHNPTVMNGAVMKNFVSESALFASALVGRSDLFVSEVDESDGSIARYNPRLAVLNNIALDHKSMDELRALFSDFVAKADLAVINLDNDEVARIAAGRESKMTTYSLHHPHADILASDLRPAIDGISFCVHERSSGITLEAKLGVPGRHNVANALAALGAAMGLGVKLPDAVAALGRFTGIKRRLDLVGSVDGISVIDDFAHNPDKIHATLNTLHDFPGRLLVMFQPHGFGPLKLMKDGFIDCFADNLAAEDILIMPAPVYFGGTVDRSVSSEDIVAGVRAKGRDARALPDRAACGALLQELARPGDRIVIMGARDDTLSQFASELLRR